VTGYTKLFSSILASTVWDEDANTRIVWITLLAMANRDGVAEASVPGLARFARVSLDACRRALRKLQAPDVDSRTKDDEGRRIRPVDGGFLIVNHAKYRARMNADDRRAYQAKWVAESRAKGKGGKSGPKTPCRHGVDKRRQTSTRSTHTEAEAEADTGTPSRALGSPEGAAPPAAGAAPHRPADAGLARASSPTTTTRKTPRAPERRGHRSHAFCGHRFCVPTFLDDEFRAAVGPDALERYDLDAWYAGLDTEMQESAKPLLPDPKAWLQARFRETLRDTFGDPARRAKARR
jgi:hypothetical protein